MRPNNPLFREEKRKETTLSFVVNKIKHKILYIMELKPYLVNKICSGKEGKQHSPLDTIKLVENQY